ncbi:MAG: TRAP transporter fused permease subunit [Ferrovibrio sp.]|uniref:TRAP transporter permease n=1 Tax=Ferrovibrio sp. TaxID=1917215 RepID=UPI00261525CD|nr:TRAP transporter fused permease subunit [Ferrovibrio sp.]MCW0234281.1 TRAP transporter fused permease subunit [Ferrovibrio sp.]
MRQINGSVGIALGIWTGLWAALHIYWAGFGYPEPLTTRALHILAFLPPAFLLFPATGRSSTDKPSVLDWLLAAASLLPPAYVYHYANEINLRIAQLDPVLPLHIVLGLALVALLLEAVRRAVAPALMIIAGIMVVYLFVCDYMPGFLQYRSFSTGEIVEGLYLSGNQGVFGFITGISATVVSAFIIFGAFIEGTGSGRLFMNLGTRAAGRYVGGAAKVGVVTSGLFGMISGSSTANVASVGSFTIPAMIRRGYTPTFAGGVEAAASTGGQIMPPIMGAAAFILAETTQTPYSHVIAAAALGAVLYFFSIYINVHYEARKLRLAGMRADELPTWRTVLRDAHLLLPLVTLVVLLHGHFSPNFAAFWSLVTMIAVASLRAHTRLGVKDFLAIVAKAGRAVITVALACTCANLVVTALTMTGMTLSFGSLVLSVSNGNLVVAGTLLMVVCLILGMGVPTSAAYVIAAAIGAPLLIQLGVPELAAHLFVLYFAVFAEVTPPVAVASYTAAAIAKANPMKTGLQAFRLATGGIIVGYNYLFSQALLLEEGWLAAVSHFTMNLAGLTLIAGAISGHFSATVTKPVRVIALATGISACLLHDVPITYRVMAVVALLAAIYGWQRRQARRSDVLPLVEERDTGR